MGVDAGTPPGLWERVRAIAAEEVVKFMRSGFLRNASISDGTFTIKGGVLRLLFGDVDVFYIGPVDPPLPDGTPQQGWIVRRADGSTVLDLRDAFPADDGGQLRQALNWRDRSGHVVFADDTNSGEGIARPWVPGVWQLSRALDWPQVANGTFETVYRAKMRKQHPRLYTAAFGWCDTPGATGEMRVMVNGVQLGPTAALDNASVRETTFGPEATSGAHMSELVIEVQARLASGTGTVRCSPSVPPEGQQT